VAFSDIGRDGRSGALQLARQTIAFFARKACSVSVALFGEIHSERPRFEILVSEGLAHAV
jgi:hypothetical protein